MSPARARIHDAVLEAMDALPLSDPRVDELWTIARMAIDPTVPISEVERALGAASSGGLSTARVWSKLRGTSELSPVVELIELMNEEPAAHASASVGVIPEHEADRLPLGAAADPPARLGAVIETHQVPAFEVVSAHPRPVENDTTLRAPASAPVRERS